MNGVVVVGAGWIGVGNGDRLIVFDGVGECEFNGGAGDGNRGDGISGAIVLTAKSVVAAVVAGALVVGEDNLGAVGVGGGRGEGWWSASNCGVVGDSHRSLSNSGVVGDQGAAQACRVIFS